MLASRTTARAAVPNEGRRRDRTRWGSLSAPPNPLAEVNGRRKRRGKEKEGEGQLKGGKCTVAPQSEHRGRDGDWGLVPLIFG